MTGIAWRNLVRERTRLAISVGGVAVAVMLILLLRGLYTGVNEEAARYLRSIGADLWIGQNGTRGGFGHSVSVLPADLREQVEQVEGVEQVAPLFGRPVVVTVGDDDEDLFLMGYDPDAAIGGPPEVLHGAESPGAGEIILDRVFADQAGLDVGDDIEVTGRRMRVAGIGAGGNSLITQYAWVAIPDVEAISGTPGVVSYLVVRTNASTTPDDVARRITSAVPGTTVTSADEFVSESTADIRESFVPILFVLVVIAVVIGTAVIGLTIYTSVIEKRQEYGVLKALGFSNRRLFGIVCRQSLVAGFLGLVAGAILSTVVSCAIEGLLPEFVTVLRPADYGLVVAATAVMSALASLLPVRRVARLDPASVFRV
ncbi:MAG: ABC transporter permease [Acidimicrobiia bacterium]